MTVHVDTSVLISRLTTAEGAEGLSATVTRGDRLVMSSIVLYEWLRGPRTSSELALTDALFPADTVVVFDASAARTAARLYRTVRRPRARMADLTIAACALEHDAALWTLNADDFSDIAGLRLYSL